MADVTMRTESASNQGQTVPAAGAPAANQQTQSTPLEVRNAFTPWHHGSRNCCLLTPVVVDV